MNNLKTFLSTHEYYEDFSILFDDKYVKLLETYMNLHEHITLVWGGPSIYQLAYTGLCNLEDHLYKSHIMHHCFTKYRHKNMSNILCTLRPLSTSLVNLENYLNIQKQSNNWGDYELDKYKVTMKRINTQKVRTIRFNNLTIHLLSISDNIHYLDQILEHKYKHQILKGHSERKALENEVLDFYNIKFNNKPSFSIVQSPSADTHGPTPPGPSPTPPPGPSPTPSDPRRLIPRLVTYVDSRGISWSTPPLVNAGPTEYTDIMCSFFLPSSDAGKDFAEIVLNPNPVFGGKAWIDLMQNAGKRVMVSSGGATDLPTSASYFTTHEPVALAKHLADLIKAVKIDGIDIDWEDDWSNSNPGLTGYGAPTTREIGSGPAVQWLITLTKELRNNLPYPDYTITHAPQAPYFNIGYHKVWYAIKDDNNIDWFNVQFYNQGPYYIDEESLVDCNAMVINPSSPSACMTWNGSISNVQCASGCKPMPTGKSGNSKCLGYSPSPPCSLDTHPKSIPANKIVVGKPVKQGDGNSGIVAPDKLLTLLKTGIAKFPALGGVMGWQWGSDTDGSWAKTLRSAWPDAPAPPPPTPLPAPTPPPAPSPAPTPPPPSPKPKCPCPGCNKACCHGNVNCEIGNWNPTTCSAPYGTWCP